MYHHSDIIMGTMASQITSLTIVYSTIYSDADLRIHQSSASLAFVWGEFPAQRASYAENVSIWWRHHVFYAIYASWIFTILHNYTTDMKYGFSLCMGNCVHMLWDTLFKRKSPQKEITRIFYGIYWSWDFSFYMRLCIPEASQTSEAMMGSWLTMILRGATDLFKMLTQIRLGNRALYCIVSWWCHQMETFSELLALCVGNSLITTEFPASDAELWCFLWSASE